MSENIYDVIIIGAGPGGMTAAVYTSRANLKTLLIERGVPGGQLQNTEEIENFPSYDHIAGPDLAQNMFVHALKFGAEYEQANVKEIVDEGDVKIVHSDSQTYKARAVIIATGTKYKKLGIPGEEEFSGRGVSWCAVCDGAFFRDKELVVVGGGDSAVEESVFLTKFAKKVTVLHRRDRFRAQPILVDRMLKNEKIDVVYNTVVNEIVGEGKVNAVLVENIKTSEVTTFPTDGVFEYIGMNPVSDFVRDLKITDQEGWIITDDRMKTAVAGIYAIGDIRKDAIRQVVTATGDGCVAAIEVQHFVENLKEQLAGSLS
ncbi:thioredoxin-disulfide reductase [Pseudobacillus wudalianchiensis]|uniref:Thioredoxin reductase n=1 Tax=Pseudobacillus wudalianchiensis TaxID=1743143 RepID=A0A1B9ADX4_9BACI|nr:thioredoxin-disulfide reductase [Bacillus wudalianchiensis]OCA82035.1 thioredoxin-disulfide reductase [Bacillus wudalianchiensis]